MQGEQTTGTPNTTYNLVSVLYHALEGATTYDQYAQDAEREGDQELARYFRETVQQANRSAEQAKQLLKSRL
jgi:rubrerythrin